MARPAASSFALLTRMPDDNRCMDVASEDCEADRLRCAVNDETLVLIVVPIYISCLKSSSQRQDKPSAIAGVSYGTR